MGPQKLSKLACDVSKQRGQRNNEKDGIYQKYWVGWISYCGLLGSGAFDKGEEKGVLSMVGDAVRGGVGCLILGCHGH